MPKQIFFDFLKAIEYLEEIEIDVPQVQTSYTAKQGAKVFNCNDRTFINLINQGHILAMKLEYSSGMEYTVFHGNLMSFARKRTYWIKRDIEEAIFEKGLIPPKDLVAPSGRGIVAINAMIRYHNFPNLNISASQNYEDKPYYRLPPRETLDELIKLRGKRFGLQSETNLKINERKDNKRVFRK